MTDKDIISGNEYGDTTDKDEFSNITVDLVSLARHEPFLERLFASPACQWVALDQACAALGDIQRRIDGFQEAAFRRVAGSSRCGRRRRRLLPDSVL
jgi:hypothetical protein